MNQILLTLLVAAAAWAVLRARRRSARRHPTPPPVPTSAPMTAVDSVRCAHCGLHLPQQQAIRRDGLWYCCREHADLGPASSEQNPRK